MKSTAAAACLMLAGCYAIPGLGGDENKSPAIGGPDHTFVTQEAAKLIEEKRKLEDAVSDAAVRAATDPIGFAIDTIEGIIARLHAALSRKTQMMPNYVIENETVTFNPTVGDETTQPTREKLVRMMMDNWTIVGVDGAPDGALFVKLQRIRPKNN